MLRRITVTMSCFGLIPSAFSQVVIADAVRLTHVNGPASGELTIDNGDTAFFSTGTWSNGNFGGGFQGDYIYKNQSDDPLGTALWLLSPPVAGDYELSLWYPAGANRSPQVHCRLEHGGGITDLIADQTTGGDWSSLGIFTFEPSDHLFQISNRVTANLAEPLTIDNGDLLFSTVGPWTTGSSSPGYEDDYLYAGCTSPEERFAMWSLPIFEEGNYEVEVSFYGGTNRNPSTKFLIEHAQGTRTLFIDQTVRDENDQYAWHSLGVYPMNSGRHEVRLSNEGPEGSVVIADALRFRFSEHQGPAPPMITLNPRALPTPASGESVVVSAEIWSPSPLTNVALLQNLDNNTLTHPMWDDGLHGDAQAGDGIFAGEIMGGDAATVLEYRVMATNADGGSAESPLLKCLVAYEHSVSPELRALFSSSITTPERVDEILRRARENNFNAVIPFVMGNGYVLWDSAIAPKNPAVQEGFDALAYLIDQAHSTEGGQRRIQVHVAVVNYHARGDEYLPPEHILSAHPEWISETYAGEIYGYDRLYMDQGVPAVQSYLIDLYTELLTHYEIDGLNLDFIRYRGNQIWGYNAIALTEFHEHTGRDDRPEPSDPEWCDWRREQVSVFVRRVGALMQTLRPQALLSIDATTGGAPVEPLEENIFYRSVLQNWPEWISEGYIDGAWPMAYRDEMNPVTAQEYRDWITFGQAHRADREVSPIVGGYKNTVQHNLVQMHALRQSGNAWQIFYTDHSPHIQPLTLEAFHRAARSQMFPVPVDSPTPPWMVDGREALVTGIVTSGERTAERVRLSLDGKKEIRTDLNGCFAFFNVSPGPHAITVLDADNATLGGASLTLTQGEVCEINITLGITADNLSGTLIH